MSSEDYDDEAYDYEPDGVHAEAMWKLEARVEQLELYIQELGHQPPAEPEDYSVICYRDGRQKRTYESGRVEWIDRDGLVCDPASNDVLDQTAERAS